MKFVLGVDEAGRGPLAGPVAVGILRAPKDFDFYAVFPNLNDSKKVTEKRREEMFETLVALAKEGTLSFCVKSVDAEVIDRVGISEAIASCVEKGVRSLAEASNSHVYLDGSLHAPKEYTQETVIDGDASIPAIMLASIAAKVSRDRLMKKLAKTYPHYGFEQHKGYGTKAHITAIRTMGLTPIHRRSFCRNFA